MLRRLILKILYPSVERPTVISQDLAWDLYQSHGQTLVFSDEPWFDRDDWVRIADGITDAFDRS